MSEQQAQTRKDIESRIIAKAWKNEAFKQELLTNPKPIIEQEFGVELPAELNVSVYEENSTSLYFVLPILPQIEGRELSEEELESVAGGFIGGLITIAVGVTPFTGDIVKATKKLTKK
ncbi:NHLP leader peptide family RiPP precursor [Nostoc punctiforme]|uniref:Nitrile hydratase-like protein n=1 Tax=Nostoc punctiforme (strain ATCC 29133 / PCC 73102) TaxID=63737 RepID=B2IYT2_NOSP7|nr:NHLP leader peptide family RiPP precursor [Nostoc punctiforme]ACC81665.1 nitrile hydratase-like protein [Nostoc punctiforme PCC 73102]